MSITINGTGSITGISAGGLPDASITSDDIAAGAVTAAKLAAGAGGKILQVVHLTKTSSDTFSPASNTTWYGYTGMDLSITPSSTNSKILYTITFGRLDTTTTFIMPWLIRRSIGGGAYSYPIIGDQLESNRKRASFTAALDYNNNRGTVHSFSFVDSPATASQVTYSLEWMSNATVYLNRDGNAGDDGSNYAPTTASTLILQEIGQ